MSNVKEDSLLAILNKPKNYTSPNEVKELNKSVGLSEKEFEELEGLLVTISVMDFNKISYIKRNNESEVLEFKLVPSKSISKQIKRKAIKYSQKVANELLKNEKG